MSIFRNIVANGIHDPATTVELSTTPSGATTPGVMFTIDGAHGVIVSLADGRELAGWLIQECCGGEQE